MSYEIRNDKLLREAYEAGRRQGLNETAGWWIPPPADPLEPPFDPPWWYPPGWPNSPADVPNPHPDWMRQPFHLWGLKSWTWTSEANEFGDVVVWTYQCYGDGTCSWRSYTRPWRQGDPGPDPDGPYHDPPCYTCPGKPRGKGEPNWPKGKEPTPGSNPYGQNPDEDDPNRSTHGGFNIPPTGIGRAGIGVPKGLREQKQNGARPPKSWLNEQQKIGLPLPRQSPNRHGGLRPASRPDQEYNEELKKYLEIYEACVKDPNCDESRYKWDPRWQWIGMPSSPPDTGFPNVPMG